MLFEEFVDLMDQGQLPGKGPKDLISRKRAQNLERTMTWCLVCMARGTIVMREVGHRSILVCKSCRSVYDVQFRKAFSGEIWFVKIKSVGNAQDKSHMIGHRYDYPFDEEKVIEERDIPIPGKPVTVKRAIRAEKLVREELEHCILCKGKDSLRMRDFGMTTQLVCVKCGARFKALTNIKGYKLKSLRIVSVGNSGFPEKWNGRKIPMPLDLERFQEDIINDPPGDPPSYDSDFKLERLAEDEVPMSVVCGSYNTLRFRRVKHSSKLVCINCHSVFRPVTDLKTTKISRVKVESSGKLKRDLFVGKYLLMEDMKKDER